MEVQHGMGTCQCCGCLSQRWTSPVAATDVRPLGKTWVGLSGGGYVGVSFSIFGNCVLSLFLMCCSQGLLLGDEVGEA